MRVVSAAIVLGLLGACASSPSVVENPTESSEYSTLIASKGSPACAKCKATPEVVFIEVRGTSGSTEWGSKPGREPERLFLKPGRWRVKYFCSGVLDFEGNQEISLEAHATYAANCFNNVNYSLVLNRVPN